MNWVKKKQQSEIAEFADNEKQCISEISTTEFLKAWKKA